MESDNINKTPIQLFKESRSKVPYLLKKDSGWLNNISFGYLNKIVDAGNKKPFNFDMLNNVHDIHTYEYNFERFKEMVETDLKNNPKTEYRRLIIKYLKKHGYTKAEWVQATSYLIQIPIPILIKILLEWLENDTAPFYQGWLIVLGIGLLSFLKPALMHYGTSIKFRYTVMSEICTRVTESNFFPILYFVSFEKS